MIRKQCKKTGKHSRAAAVWLAAVLVFLVFVPVLSLAVEPSVTYVMVTKYAVADKGMYVDASKWFLSCNDPLTISPPQPVTGAKPNVPVPLTFKVVSKNGVKQYINISVSGDGITFSPKSGMTSAAGEFSSSFTPARVGTYFVCVTASTPRCTTNSTTTVLVSHTPPVADILASPPSPSGPNPLTVTFDASGSSAADGATITGWAWEFSDGGTDTKKTATHTFRDAKTYSVSLIVTDSYGEKSFPKKTISYVVTARESLTAVNQSPVLPVKEKESTDFQIVVTKGGKGFAGANVTVVSQNPSIGDVTVKTVKTDTSGIAIFTFRALTAGNATLSVTADDPQYVSGTREIKIQVNPPDSQLPIILIAVGALILLAIIIIVAFLWTRSNFMLRPKMKEIPADGRSAMPIRIQFTNGFGQLKKQGSDREIHLEATAGTIQDITIPAGKEYVDATLTAGKEVGLVTVTATAGDKAKATTEVRFTGDEASVDVQISPPEIPADGTSTATIILRVRDRNGAFLTFLNEKVIGLTATMGTVPATVKIEPRAPSGNATITSSDKTGTAIVRARTGAIAGEGSVQFKGLAMRYCMHCGKQMAMDASSCPNCGKIPPSGVDTKQCSTCNAVLPQPAVYCDKCGARQPQG